MQLKVRKLAWILGGLSAIGVTSLVVVACTSNGDDDVAPPGVDASRADTRPTSTGPTPPPPDGSTNPQEDGGTAPDCGNVPRLRSPFPPDASDDASATFFCIGREGGAPFCSSEQTCCAGAFDSAGRKFDPSYCSATKTEVCAPGPTAPRGRWECGSPETCGAGQKCCIPGTDGGPPAVDTEKVNGKTCPPEFQRGFFIGGTNCRSDCASGELTVCTKDVDCTGGKKCVAFETNSRQLGYCK